MSGFEWFLLVVVVILVPLVVAVAITLWTLEMARQRNRRNREAANPAGGPVKRKATRDSGAGAAAGVSGTIAADQALSGLMREAALEETAMASVTEGGVIVPEDDVDRVPPLVADDAVAATGADSSEPVETGSDGDRTPK
jgi:hypothetical protein